MKSGILILFLFMVTTSSSQIYNENDSKLCEILTNMLERDQKFRSMDELNTFSGTPIPEKIVTDSLWNLQIQIDDYNTEKLIGIIKKSGWPNQEKLKCNPKILPMIIFRHSQEKYFKDISAIIELEFVDGRMKLGEYKAILNHINGKPKFR